MSHAEQIEALKGLLERVRRATAADRRLDYELFRAFAEKEAANHWDLKAGHFYTRDIGDALSLLERMRPDWSFSVSIAEGVRQPRVTMMREQPTSRTITVRHRKEALAICQAAVEALLSQEESNGL